MIQNNPEISGKKKLFVVSAPSGGGKSTVARYLLKKCSGMRFSISATTRKRRPNETYGLEYFFLSKDEFIKKIHNDEFVEFEIIYGNYYGTLRSEIEKALSIDYSLLFDIDVKGALSLRKEFPDDTLLIFLRPPSLSELQKRLQGRSTESDEQIAKRMERAQMELEQEPLFDYTVINGSFEETYAQIDELIDKHFVNKQIEI